MYASDADPTIVQNKTSNEHISLNLCQSISVQFLARRHYCPATIPLLLNNNFIEPQKSEKYLDVIVDECLNWSDYVKFLCRRSLAAMHL